MFGKRSRKKKMLDRRCKEPSGVFPAEVGVGDSSTFLMSSTGTISANTLDESTAGPPSSHFQDEQSSGAPYSSFPSADSVCGSEASSKASSVASWDDSQQQQQQLFDLPRLFPYHNELATIHSIPQEGMSQQGIESSCASSQEESAWDVQPHFDFPQLFPYHTGFISVTGGRATSTIDTPSVADSQPTANSNSTGSSSASIRSLGLDNTMGELHSKELKRPRPIRRLLAIPQPTQPVVLPEQAPQLAETDNHQSTNTNTNTNTVQPPNRLKVQWNFDKESVKARKQPLETQSKRQSAQDWLQSGHLQNDLGHYEHAMNDYHEALHWLGNDNDNDKDELERATCYISMGKTLLNQGKSEQAFRYIHKGNKLLQQQQQQQSVQKDWDQQITQLLARADLQMGLPFDEALGRLRVSRKIVTARKDWKTLLELHLTTGRVYTRCQDYMAADQWYEDALAIIQNRVPLEEQESIQSYVARLYLAKGDLHHQQTVYSMKALEFYQEALSICKAHPSIDLETTNEALVALADHYCDQGREAEALSYYEQAYTTELSALHGHVLLKRGILRYRLGEYTNAYSDLRDYCFQSQNEEQFVPLLTQAICLYMMGTNHTKARRLYKEAMAQSRDLMLESHVQKSLAKTWSKMNRARLKKAWGRLRRGSQRLQLDVLRE